MFILYFYSVLHTFNRDNGKLNCGGFWLQASEWKKVVQIDTHVVTAHDLFEMGPYLWLSSRLAQS